MICDLWAVVSLSEGEERFLLEELIALVEQTKLDEIYPDAKEIICYYGFCAMVLLKHADVLENYLEKYIYPNVENTELKQKIKNLLDNPDGYNAKDLKIV